MDQWLATSEFSAISALSEGVPFRVVAFYGNVLPLPQGMT
jgi:hypothetical protein